MIRHVIAFLHIDFEHLAVFGGADVVVHLHCLEDNQEVTGFHLLPLLQNNLNDRSRDIRFDVIRIFRLPRRTCQMLLRKRRLEASVHRL